MKVTKKRKEKKEMIKLPDNAKTSLIVYIKKTMFKYVKYCTPKMMEVDKNKLEFAAKGIDMDDYDHEIYGDHVKLVVGQIIQQLRNNSVRKLYEAYHTYLGTEEDKIGKLW